MIELARETATLPSVWTHKAFIAEQLQLQLPEPVSSSELVKLVVVVAVLHLSCLSQLDFSSVVVLSADPCSLNENMKSWGRSLSVCLSV